MLDQAQGREWLQQLVTEEKKAESKSQKFPDIENERRYIEHWMCALRAAGLSSGL